VGQRVDESAVSESASGTMEETCVEEFEREVVPKVSFGLDATPDA
jgi:hypothetical protein